MDDLFAKVDGLLKLAHDTLSNGELDQVGVAIRRWSEKGFSPAESTPKLVEWDKNRVADRLIGHLKTAAEKDPDQVGALRAYIYERLPNY